MKDLKALIVDARAGDEKAFACIVKRFERMAYAGAYSMLGDFHEAQDVAQDAFFEVYRRLPELKTPEAFVPWFRKIVFTSAHRMLRVRKLRMAATLSMEEVSTGSKPDLELADRIFEKVRKLPEAQRVAVTLFYMGNHSCKEMAAFLELPMTTVKKRLADARRRLRESMRNNETKVLERSFDLNALPEDFATRLLRFSFPVTRPDIKIEDGTDQLEALFCVDQQEVPLPFSLGSRCDWARYRSDCRLRHVFESCIVAEAKWGKGKLLRQWMRRCDFDSQSSSWAEPDWSEWHILVENETWRFVDLQRKGGGIQVRKEDFLLPGGSKPFNAVPMLLKPGMQWAENEASGKVVGTSKLRIGKKAWRCLKIVVERDDRTAMAEHYVSEVGRTVLNRHFRGTGWQNAAGTRNFESLAGALEIEWHGSPYRLNDECIPDVALNGKLL